jgi:hypothetical protein
VERLARTPFVSSLLSFTDAYGVSTVTPSMYKGIDTQRIKQAKAIRDLLRPPTPENQCVLLQAGSTNLFSVSDAKHFNDRKGETVGLIGAILGSVYYVSPLLGRCRPFPERSIMPSEMMLDTRPQWRASKMADMIKGHLDQGLSSHTIGNLVSAPSHRPHSVNNFSTQLDLIQEISFKHPTFESCYANATTRLVDNALDQNFRVTPVAISQVRWTENFKPHQESSSDFLIDFLNELDGMVSKSCATSACVLALEKNGKSVLAPPNIRIGDVVCKLEGSTLRLILRPNNSRKPESGARTDAETLAETNFNSGLYTIVGQAISLFSSSLKQTPSKYIAPSVNIHVDAPALQILTRLSSSEESASTQARE